jgi:hypothetical protein
VPPEVRSPYDQARNQAIRLRCIEAYGGECSCCGETEFVFLVIDHVNGGGAEHRRQIGAGNALCQWLIKNNFPDGFQVLCWNCNYAKHRLGVCPHQRAKEVAPNGAEQLTLFAA